MKNIKILIVLTLALGALTLNSCKKDNKDPAASITATVDGTATSYNTTALAVTGSVDNVTFTSIQGTSSSGTTLSITLNGTVTAGKTYSNTATNDEDKPLLMLSSSNDITFLNDDSSTTNPVSVTITSVSSTSIEGTFKGDLVELSIGNAAATKSVTNGKFFVKLSKQ